MRPALKDFYANGVGSNTPHGRQEFRWCYHDDRAPAVEGKVFEVAAYKRGIGGSGDFEKHAVVGIGRDRQ